MLKSLLNPVALCASALISLALVAPASAVVTVYTVELTNTENTLGGNASGRGVWFNPTTGYAEVRDTDTFRTPLFEDGQYMLVWDVRFTTPAAQIFTQGLFSRGNNVLTDAVTNGNPIRFAPGASISASSGTAGGFSDLGPTFGNWDPGDRGYIGLRIGDGDGNTSTNRYGYADITLNADSSTTLHSFAFESVANAAILAPAFVPEPASLSLFALGGMTVMGRRRRNA